MTFLTGTARKFGTPATGGSVFEGSFMKGCRLTTLCLFVIGLCAYTGAQNRPIIDEGTVKDTTRRPAIPTINPEKGSRVASKPNNGVLFIVTDQDAAAVLINGVHRGKVEGKQLRIELPVGKRYAIEVTAGSDYVPFKETILLKSGQVVKAPLMYKYGTVSIGPAFPDGAKVLVDDQALPPERLQSDTTANLITISGLMPGKHTITYDHPDYVIVKHTFDIAAGSNLTYTFNPERAVDDLVVTTDPVVAVYVDDRHYGETAADGTLKVSIPLGPHDVKLEKYGFETFKEKDNFQFRSPVTLSRKLVPVANSAEFHEDFDIPEASKSRWSMPSSGWKLENGRFYIENCPNLAYPKGLNYRDFTMAFHLKIGNGIGAAWALRVKDSGNYYLFYLTGPGSDFPNRFLTYIVRDNKFDPKNPNDSVPLIFRLEAGGEYTVDITATGNVISHIITSSKTGKASPSGELKDNDNTFYFGDVGFRTIGAESFSVDEIYVRPPSVKPGN
jgi:hypothetical protein